VVIVEQENPMAVKAMAVAVQVGAIE